MLLLRDGRIMLYKTQNNIIKYRQGERNHRIVSQ